VTATSAPRGAAASAPAIRLAYYWGDDIHGLERAAGVVADRTAAEAGGPLDRWRTIGADTTAAVIGERVATGTLFGGGTIVIVVEPLPLIRGAERRDALAAILPTLAPGNALVFLDSFERPPRSLDRARAAFVESIRDAGGEVRSFLAPNAAAMPAWIADRARERGLQIAPRASHELARRVGALVRESDVDRRQQGQLAVNELDKLALLHPDGGEATFEDVEALVPEAIPSSTWALLDAIGERRTKQATELLGRLVDTTPHPLLVAQLHGRMRQLLEVTDRIAAGEDPRSLPRTTGIKPYPAEKLAGMSHRWTVAELEAALDGVYELDIIVKGADGSAAGDQARRLAFMLWLAEHVARA
jgi:DNA polymerase III delta subunit